MKRIYFVLFLLLFQPLLHAEQALGDVSSTEGTNKELDLRNINKQIASLEDLKEHYVGRAIRLRNRADRTQFNSQENGLISAQKYWKEANKCDRIADQIQKEIDSLKEEREFVEDKKPY
ncbi:hypothetical protein K0U07_04420 [bacterium]|nr:hypothetical protein [bacterium]